MEQARDTAAKTPTVKFGYSWESDLITMGKENKSKSIFLHCKTRYYNKF
jgi:hypothetical protein